VSKRELSSLLAILASVLIAGFTISPLSFGENILSSVADLIVGILIAFYLIDRISRREKSRRWQRIERLSYRSIESTCELIKWAIITDCVIPLSSDSDISATRIPQYIQFLDLAKQIGRDADKLSTGDQIIVDPRVQTPGQAGSVASSVNGITRASDERLARILSDQQSHRISSQQLLCTVKPYFDNLSLTIFPRIFELGEETELIASCIEVEAAYQEWISTVDTIEGDWGMPENYAWEAVAELCTRLSNMLRVIEPDLTSLDGPRR
jgi:hypothetical protein